MLIKLWDAHPSCRLICLLLVTSGQKVLRDLQRHGHHGLRILKGLSTSLSLIRIAIALTKPAGYRSHGGLGDDKMACRTASLPQQFL